MSRATGFVLFLVLAVPANQMALAAEDAGNQDARLTFHQAPRPLAQNAAADSWPRFLGPRDNATTPERPLLAAFPESAGPPLVWEIQRGAGYASPAIADGRLILFHRIDERETVECRHPESGKLLWTFDYPVEYRDRYGFSNGPRAGPVISGGRVYTYGVTAILHCLDLTTGKIVWKRDLKADFSVPQYFFGSGPSPLVLGDKLIQNVGGDACVAAFDLETGATLWATKDAWGASYASPVAAALRGKQRVLVFAGGESDPAHGGLLMIDPETGAVDDRFPWRADKYESVNASTPVAIDDTHVYISECYEKGGVMLEIGEDMKFNVAWKAPDFGMHWMTPVLTGGFLYGFRGRNEPDAFLACYEAATGKEMWRETLSWKSEIDGQKFGWSFFRGSLLRAGGDRYICLGEMGTLAFMNLTPQGAKVTSQADLFRARSTWTLPALHRGLLYVSQNEPDLADKAKGRRLLCYDLRAE